MTKHVLVINGHPDPSPQRLCSALADAYEKGAAQARLSTTRINIGAINFPLLRNAADFLSEPLDSDLLSARAHMRDADHIVFIYPLWLGGPPALLKGFMEQIARKEFALGAGVHGWPIGKLRGRSAHVIVTMGMPALAYRLWFGAHGVKAFNRSILGIAGIKPVVTTYLGGMSPTRSLKFIAQAEHFGRNGA